MDNFWAIVVFVTHLPPIFVGFASCWAVHGFEIGVAIYEDFIRSITSE